jgi:hypothetical protein
MNPVQVDAIVSPTNPQSLDERWVIVHKHALPRARILQQLRQLALDLGQDIEHDSLSFGGEEIEHG